SAETVRELGPRTVSRALLARLSPDGHALAGAAAVLGARSDLGAAGELAGLSAEAVAAAADELRANHVMRPAATALEFVHPVIREAVLGELRPARRAALHGAAAARLHEAGAAPERIAAHLSCALPGTLPGDAVEILFQAARKVLAEGDAAAAAAYLERAADEAPGDARLDALLGTALLRAGRAAEGRRRLRAAVDATDDPIERADRVARASAATLEVEGPAAAAEELRSALDALPPSAPDAPRLLLEARLAAVCTFLPDERERSGRRLAAFAGLPGATVDERQLLALLAQWRFGAGVDAAGVAELVERALGDGSFIRTAGFEVLVWGQALHAAIFADGTEVAEREVAHGRALVQRTGSPEEFAAVSVVECFLRWRTGDVARCEALAAGILEALELADGTALAAALRAVGTRFVAAAALERGDADAAAAALDAYARAADPQTPPLVHGRVGLARAALALQRDEPALALREAEAVGAAEAASATDNPAVAWRSIAAMAELRLGREPAARLLAARQLELARRWGAASDIGAALRLAARVGEGDRVALLEQAIATLEDSPARLELAAALCDLGEAMRVERRRREAHAPLEAAAAMAETLGAQLLRARALDSLAALGDRPRKLAFAGADSLTASERRVAELAAAGRSNREIAQELFVTPKTVENHLGRVYVKLGIGGRRELSGVLAAA
ncbi:MAG TPA: LuxR C-terminal-related transcriptional regulator, partial [Capillimicrobium sp.]